MAEAAEIRERRGDHGRHFLVVGYGIQGHINPARALARRLARVRVDGGVRVTLSVSVSGHGRMFPSLASPDEEATDGLISYVPYDDGYKFGDRPRTAEERARLRRDAARGISAVARRLAAAGRPATCVVSALSLPAADAAAELGIPVAVWWIQPAGALAAYYHFFHGHERAVASRAAEPEHEVSLPGMMRPLRIRDFPSFLVDATGSEESRASVEWMRELLEFIGREKPRVLVNTADVLEAEALEAMRPYLDVVGVGPMVPPPPRRQTGDAAAAASEERIHLYELGDGKRYVEWLDARPARSVVYLSFGSMLTYTPRQVEEMLLGLRECGRPYLWVVRRDGREEEVERRLAAGSGDDQGIVVEWCDQLEVLSHAAVGCFVTHCGWNSTLEAVTLGVPMVAAPNWSDQAMSAHLVEDHWGVGVRADRDGEGILPGAEMTRCVEAVMGGGDRAAEIRERVENLKERALEVIAEGGSAEITLKNFVEAMENLV